MGRCSPSFLPVGGIAGHEGQTGEEDRQMVGHTIKGWVPPLWAPRCPISHTFPPPAGCHVRSTPGRDLHPWLHPLAPGGEPEQTPMSTRLSPFTSPGRTQTPGSRARSQAPQKARELPSSGPSARVTAALALSRRSARACCAAQAPTFSLCTRAWGRGSKGSTRVPSSSARVTAALAPSCRSARACCAAQAPTFSLCTRAWGRGSKGSTRVPSSVLLSWDINIL